MTEDGALLIAPQRARRAWTYLVTELRVLEPVTR